MLQKYSTADANASPKQDVAEARGHANRHQTRWTRRKIGHRQRPLLRRTPARLPACLDSALFRRSLNNVDAPLDQPALVNMHTSVTR
jgi:hypothetical protein